MMLHVIKNFYFLTDFILDALADDPETEIVTPEPVRRGALARTWRIAEAFLFPRRRKTIFYRRAYTDRLQSIPPDDSVLFFGEQNLKALLILRRFIAARRVSVWIWNPLRGSHRSPRSRRSYARRLRRAGYDVFTFDPQDAAECGFTLAPQVYRNVDEYRDPEVEPQADLFFVGADKGRLETLSALETTCREAGLTTCFHIVRGKHSPNDARLAGEMLSYGEVVDRINRSRALVEILQGDQSGATVRSLEAAFFGKKLITDQKQIRCTPLYHPDNIFLLGEDDPRRLADFMSRPYSPVPAETLRRYDVRSWVKQFEICV